MASYDEEEEKDEATAPETETESDPGMVRRTTSAEPATMQTMMNGAPGGANAGGTPRWGQAPGGAMGGGRFGAMGGGGMGGPAQGQRPDWGAIMGRFQQRLGERSPMLGQVAQRFMGGMGGPQGAPPPQGAPAPGGAPGAPGAAPAQPAPWMQGPISQIAQRIAAQRGGGAPGGQPPVDPAQQQPGGIMGRRWGQY